jgi:hypothetical protein
MWCNPTNGRIWTWKIVHFLNPASQFKIKWRLVIGPNPPKNQQIWYLAVNSV